MLKHTLLITLLIVKTYLADYQMTLSVTWVSVKAENHDFPTPCSIRTFKEQMTYSHNMLYLF